MLESLLHSESCFVTLTYRDPPVGPPRGSLAPVDAVLWLKRLRKAVFPTKLRFFLVGEYGSKTLRPHYHVLLFGMPWNPSSEAVVEKTWGRGFVQLGEVNQATIRYCVGYVLKKMTRPGSCGGRVPEFARFSIGIGKAFASALVSSFSPGSAARSALSNGVPTTVRIGGQTHPLGRYIRNKVAEELGIPATPDHVKKARQAEVFDLLARAPPGTTVQQVVQNPNRSASVIARERIFKTKEKL